MLSSAITALPLVCKEQQIALTIVLGFFGGFSWGLFWPTTHLDITHSGYCRFYLVVRNIYSWLCLPYYLIMTIYISFMYVYILRILYYIRFIDSPSNGPLCFLQLFPIFPHLRPSLHPLSVWPLSSTLPSSIQFIIIYVFFSFLGRLSLSPSPSFYA